jgi:hypothetical protein
MFSLPAHPDRKYDAVYRCIYCGSEDNLSDEHIVPFGLGGRWVLPKASCASCAKTTSLFEQTCQRTMFGPLRLYYNMPSRRRSKRPQKLPLKVKLTAGADWSFIDVDQSIYPFLILFPILPMPDELSGYTTTGARQAAARTLWIRGASFRDGIQPHMQRLAAELKVAAIEPTGTAEIPAFCRMIAKIAHAFAVAEMGMEAFAPFLVPMIRDGDTSNSVQYVGGLQFAEPPSIVVHEVSFGMHTCKRPDIVGVRIRLLSALETPTYFVAVGRRRRPRSCSS